MDGSMDLLHQPTFGPPPADKPHRKLKKIKENKKEQKKIKRKQKKMA